MLVITMVSSSTVVIVHQQLYGGWVSSDNAPSHLLPFIHRHHRPSPPADSPTLSPPTALRPQHRRAPKGWLPTQIEPGELYPHRRRDRSSVDADDCSTDDVTGRDCRRVPRVQNDKQNHLSKTSSKGGLPRVDFQGCGYSR